MVIPVVPDNGRAEGAGRVHTAARVLNLDNGRNGQLDFILQNLQQKIEKINYIHNYPAESDSEDSETKTE